ncbi:MAG: hypothetical protein JOY51_09260, partial [Nevskia sp.]|nr:hypothetical protein [Nevskia sp.]
MSRLSRMLSLALLAAAPLAAVAAAGSSWVSTNTKAWPTLAKVNYLGAAPASKPLHIAVALRLKYLSDLQKFIVQVNTPGNPTFGHYLTPSQFAATYAPSQGQAMAVVNYLAQNGFRNITLAPNRLVITADGTIGAAQSAFNTSFSQVKLADGRVAYLNNGDAQVPAALAPTVLAVLGLHNVATMHPFHSRAAGVPSPNSINGYTPQNFWQAYDVAKTPTGAGTPIAIIAEGDLVDTGEDVEADLRTFESMYQLPKVPYTL